MGRVVFICVDDFWGSWFENWGILGIEILCVCIDFLVFLRLVVDVIWLVIVFGFLEGIWVVFLYFKFMGLVFVIIDVERLLNFKGLVEFFFFLMWF